MLRSLKSHIFYYYIAQKKMNWGIVGLGKIALKFASDLQLVEGAQLHALCSRSLKKASAFNEKFPAKHLFGSYEVALDCKDLDIVYIATPHVFHKELSIQFLKKGIAVLCEKPLGMNAKEVAEMRIVAHENNTFLMEAMWTRFIPAFQKMLEVIESGALGLPKTIRADFGFHSADSPTERVFNRTLGGGAILDVGIYPLFLTLSVFGQPDEVYCTTRFTETGVDETSVITLKYADNRIADLYCSLLTKTEVEASVLCGGGSVKLHSPFHHSRQLSYGPYYSASEIVHLDFPGYGYQFEIQEVEECLKARTIESKKMPLSQSLELAKLLDRVLETAGMGYE